MSLHCISICVFSAADVLKLFSASVCFVFVADTLRLLKQMFVCNKLFYFMFDLMFSTLNDSFAGILKNIYFLLFLYVLKCIYILFFFFWVN